MKQLKRSGPAYVYAIAVYWNSTRHRGSLLDRQHDMQSTSTDLFMDLASQNLR
jgi:hypothetical protein